MKNLYIILSLILISTMLSFGKPKRIGENIEVVAHKLNELIKVDGILSEGIYRDNPVSSFTQKNPTEGAQPTQKTLVWIGYDESAIYIGAKMFDTHPDSIVGLLSRRDDYNESDWFGLFLDPYHDHRTGYKFGVNAAGSVIDGILYNDSWNDDSWNGIWEYGVHKNADGWSVEIRIPFTQLRFTEAQNMVWGINFLRKIQRNNEEDYLIMVPKNESGFVSHFAQLLGLKDIKPKQRFEALPYLVSKAQYLIHDSNDPFYKGKQYQQSIGADLKYGIGSNLTLDATINPDFGQVEVDPASVNLSTFETYYDEKRPFFIEGSNIFSYGYGGSNNNWSFNWGNPEIFYSRRIGRAPQASANDEADYVDMPSESKIIGAAKITGKLGNDWSVGIIDAVTARTFANVYMDNSIYNEQVEPLTNYNIVRAQKEFNSGRQGLGFIGTSVFRNLNNQNVKDAVSQRALVYGVDGWLTMDENNTYVLNGYLSGSYLNGTQEYLINLQEASNRYYQRPDAKSFHLDSSRTSLSGFVSRVMLNKQKGNFYINTALAVVSPGFECNDVGFQWRANTINGHAVVGYRWFEPDNIFRSKDIYLATFRNYDFDGNITADGYMFFSNFQLLNYYGFGANGGYNPETFSDRLTRGGPLAKIPSSEFIEYFGNTDSRDKIYFEFYGNNAWDKLGGNAQYISLTAIWRPSSQIDFRVGPFYNYNFETLQWVDNFNDPYAVNTYNNRYVFGNLNQKTIGGEIRLNWTFTPTLSLQLFLQPLFSVGRYTNFKELAKPRTYQTDEFGKGNSTISYNSSDEEYVVDPDGNGPASQFSFSNPDFNFKSLRGNIVLRWEFLPGSLFYLVWTHGQTNEDNPGDFSFGRDFKNLWNTASDNIFLAKFSYWLDI